MAASVTKVRLGNTMSDQMNLATCVPNPQSQEFFISIYKWMLLLCEGNKCAAFLLANFIVWQNWKIRTDAYNKHLNDIAEQHGESRRLCEDVWLFKSYEGLSASILYLFGVKTIKEALKFLESKGIISIHSTPNKNHHYDKRNYFRFYPEVVNHWLKNEYPKLQNAAVEGDNEPLEKMPDALSTFSNEEDDCEDNTQEMSQVVESFDAVKVPNALGKSTEGTGKNAVTINYKPITNKNNQSINANEKHFHPLEKPSLTQGGRESIQPILTALVERGFSANKFYPDALLTIRRLREAGATLEIFMEAYSTASFATSEGGFGINYLAKVVESHLLSRKKPKANPAATPFIANNKPFESDLKNAQSWASDLLGKQE